MSLRRYDEWMFDDDFIRLKPKNDPRFMDAEYGDSPHDMGYLTAPYIHYQKNTHNPFRYQDNLVNGINRRYVAEIDKFQRNPGPYKYLNRDQITPLIWPLAQADRNLAKKVYKTVVPLYWPHQWLHFQRSLGRKWVKWLKPLVWFCELFEYLDIWADKEKYPSESADSSIIKNIFRYFVMMKENPTWLSKKLFRTLDSEFDLEKVMYDYWHRDWIDKQPPLNENWELILKDMRQWARS